MYPENNVVFKDVLQLNVKVEIPCLSAKCHSMGMIVIGETVIIVVYKYGDSVSLPHSQNAAFAVL